MVRFSLAPLSSSTSQHGLVDFLVRFASDKHSDDGEVGSGHGGIGTTVIVVVVVMVMVMVVLVADVQGSKAVAVYGCYHWQWWPGHFDYDNSSAGKQQ
jgi:hypothetical protein